MGRSTSAFANGPSIESMPMPRGEHVPSERRPDHRLTLAIYVVIALLSMAAFWPLIESQRLANSGSAAAERGDYAAAIEAWTPLAEAGDVDAQFSLGVLLDRGLGAAKDPVAAAAWYRLAAEQGSEAAQVNLGLMYILGRGVDMDAAAAAEWFQRAAAANVPQGLANLGHLYRIGRGVERDPASDPIEALAWVEYTARTEGPEARRAGQLVDSLAAELDASGRREATAMAGQLERQLRR